MKNSITKAIAFLLLAACLFGSCKSSCHNRYGSWKNNNFSEQAAPAQESQAEVG